MTISRNWLVQIKNFSPEEIKFWDDLYNLFNSSDNGKINLDLFETPESIHAMAFLKAEKEALLEDAGLSTLEQLHRAISRANPALVKRILQSNLDRIPADIDITLALQSGSEEILKHILSHAPKFNLENLITIATEGTAGQFAVSQYMWTYLSGDSSDKEILTLANARQHAFLALFKRFSNDEKSLLIYLETMLDHEANKPDHMLPSEPWLVDFFMLNCPFPNSTIELLATNTSARCSFNGKHFNEAVRKCQFKAALALAKRFFETDPKGSSEDDHLIIVAEILKSCMDKSYMKDELTEFWSELSQFFWEQENCQEYHHLLERSEEFDQDMRHIFSLFR